MIIAVQGTKNFNEYAIFLRGIGTAMRDLKDGDTEIKIYSAGPYQLNAMVMEFSNVSERSLKARGIKIKFIKVTERWLKDNVNQIDQLLFFSKPKESLTDLVRIAEAKDIEVGVYRY